MRKEIKYVIGVDEVGRGPVAGPVTVCAFLMCEDNFENLICLYDQKKLKDSKKLTQKRREKIYQELKSIKKNDNKKYSTAIDWKIINKTAKEIDEQGIAKCIRESIIQAINFLKKKHKAVFKIEDGGYKNLKIKLDGAMPKEIGEVIVKGDEKEISISLASIIAKVTRDEYMCKLDKSYTDKNNIPMYNFAEHKGYGTKKHLDSVKTYGLSDEHRKTFLRKYI